MTDEEIISPYPPFHPRSWDLPIFMPPDAFRSAFPGEGQYIEFKRGMSTRKIGQAITAFSNADGGVILIGVDDSGEVVGHRRDGESDAEVHRLVREIYDAGRYDLYDLDVDGKHVTVLAVERRTNGFAQTSEGVTLIRRGAMNAPLIGPELRAFTAERSPIRFDGTDSGVSLEEADDELLDFIMTNLGINPEAPTHVDRLVEHGLLIRTQIGHNLTIAGALYLLRELPAAMGKAFIEIFRYSDRSTEYDRRVTVEGPVDEQVSDAAHYIIDELGTDLVVVGVHRHDLPRLPFQVVREAIANAVAHREYELRGTAVRVEMRPDEVRIISPGRLPEPVTVKNMREQQAARNPSVVRVLRCLGMAEDAGRGVDVMQDSMQENLLDPPRFEETSDSVVVTLPVRSTVSAQERAWILEVESRGSILPRDKVLLVHAARGVALSNSRARSILGGVDSVEARQALQRLRDAGLLEQSGDRGGTRYRLAGGLKPPAGLRLGTDELVALVIDLALEGPVTNSLLRERTGMERSEALRILTTMVERGYLDRAGEKRGVEYTLNQSFREAAEAEAEDDYDELLFSDFGQVSAEELAGVDWGEPDGDAT